MTSKCSLFVDAGYLLASSASRLTGTSLRSGIHVKYRKLIRGLIAEAERTTGLPLLRVHWYDSAKDGVPDRAQERLGEIPKVKLRLGRFGYDGQQKGVDLRLGLDMVTHARHQAAEVFLLVSGDDDLTEAVEEVQVHGVSVVILAVPGANGQPHGVSRHLVRAADEVVTLSPTIIDDAVIPVETPEAVQGRDGEVRFGLFPVAAALAAKTEGLDGAQVPPEEPVPGPSAEAGGFVLELPDGSAAVVPMGAIISDDDDGATAPRFSRSESLGQGAGAGVPGISQREILGQGDGAANLSSSGNLGQGGGVETTSAGPAASEPLAVDLAVDGSASGLLIPVPGSFAAGHVEPAGYAAPAGQPSAGAAPAHSRPDADQGRERDIEAAIIALIDVEAGDDSEDDEGPGASLPSDADVRGNAAEPQGAADAGLVVETLGKLFPPTPRDISFNIGRPVERPLRPVYSTGPDKPKEGTWAYQWSDTILSVVGRVLVSLTKSTTPQAWNAIGMGRPSIPQDIDKALLLDATEAMGVYTLTDAERHEVRAAFWREFDAIRR